MSSLIVITGVGASIGFRCAGISAVEVEKPEETAGLLVSLQEEARYGLIAVEESLLNAVPDIVMRRIRKKGVPIIIPVNLPRKWGEIEYGESPVVKLIRKAIGYQIKIKK